MPEMIIGREQEHEILKVLYNSTEAEFLAIYGRRRVGKTYLITHYFADKAGVFFYVTGIRKASIEDQIARFTQEIGRVFYNGLELRPAATWIDTFEILHKAMLSQPKTQKLVLFFDELPWLASPKSKFLSALDYYWNKYWSNMPNCKLIICGSSAAWIIKKIINNTGGLHNRFTKRIILKPFLLNDVEKYLEYRNVKMSKQQIVKLYMAMGGIPHYLKQIKNGYSADQNINDICFSENGILFDEFEKLFSSLFTNAKQYIEIVRIIAQARQGFSRVEIEQKVKHSQKGGGLTDRLEALEAAGFIISYMPMDHQQKGIYYRIYDEYTYFYLTWIEPAKKNQLILTASNDYWMRVAKSPTYLSWAGYTFEAICYKHIAYIKSALRIDTASNISNWRFISTDSNRDGAQIDLLIDRDDGVITLFEIKYTDQPFVVDKKYQRELLNKVQAYQTETKSNKHIILVLISANGVKQNKYSSIFSHVITLEDLFR